MRPKAPTNLDRELETVNTLCEWIRNGEMTLAEAMKWFREEYECGLSYMIKMGFYERFERAFENQTVRPSAR